jgi:hypothetical protein
MMKFRLVIIIPLLLFCSSFVIARNEARLKDHVGQAISTHKDSIIKTIPLKHGYKLVYKATDTANFVLVEKGKESNEVGEEQADPKMPIDVLGYLYADFDKTFVLATHMGANPIKVVVYDKKTGGMQVYGVTPFYLDTLKGIMLYEGAYGKAGKIILYDSKTNKTELYPAPLNDTSCFGYCCWKVASITDTELKIEYYNLKNEKMIKSYTRK